MVNMKLRITEEAYEVLVSAKKPQESFSDYILRKYGNRSPQ